MRIIQAKLKGKEVVLESGTEPRQAEVVDLMERLRQSLADAGGKRRAGRPKTVKRPSSRARKRHAA